MAYKLVEITPEEYVALGDAGVWVRSDPHELTHTDRYHRSEHTYRYWETEKVRWSRMEYRYTRVELDDNHSE
jgi:hypothetical protein